MKQPKTKMYCVFPVLILISGCAHKVTPTNDGKQPTAIVDILHNNTLKQVKTGEADLTIADLTAEVRYFVRGIGQDEGGVKNLRFWTEETPFTNGNFIEEQTYGGAKVPTTPAIKQYIELRPGEKAILRSSAQDFSGNTVTSPRLILEAKYGELGPITLKIDRPSYNQYGCSLIDPNLRHERFQYATYFKPPSVLQGETVYVAGVLPSEPGTVYYYEPQHTEQKGFVRFSQDDIDNKRFKPVAATNTTLNGYWVVSPDAPSPTERYVTLTFRWFPLKN